MDSKEILARLEESCAKLKEMVGPAKLEELNDFLTRQAKEKRELEARLADAIAWAEAEKAGAELAGRRYAELEADVLRLRAALDKAIGAYHVIRSMAHDYAKAGGEGPEIRDWNEGERLILEAEAALRPEQPAEMDAGFVWPKNEVRRVKGRLGETRVRPPFTISDDDEQPAESEKAK